ncbi:MAG TPA: hypothetical protein VEU51_14930 [Candidatus Acidoferrales bacterium]|nr:hypothetical protein [Candidatus Acidoferrales bacterium]
MNYVARYLALTALLIATTVAGASDAGQRAPSQLQIAGSSIDVEFAPGAIRLSQPQIIAWIRRSGCAVAGYYGRFPVRHYLIRIVPVAGRRGVMSGTTFGYGSARTRILFGAETVQSDLDGDWVMTHEMVHLAMPSVGEEHHWIEEGIATYVEPIARAAIGNYPRAQVWQDLVVGLPKGMPARGDEGLDRTHTWGRTYWGGALFCLMAELRIRTATNNRFGLEDALRGIVASGGSIEVEWPIERVLTAGDRAVGVPALVELYAQMKSQPVAPALEAIWKNLGIDERAGSVTLDSSAPQAKIRDAVLNVMRPGDPACAEPKP